MPILYFLEPYTEQGGGGDERMDAMHLSVFRSVSNRDRRNHSSLPRLRKLSTRFFSSKRLYDIHVKDLTDFYVESVTTHSIKIIIHVFITSG